MKKPLNPLLVVIACAVLEVLIAAASWLVLVVSPADWIALICYAVIGAVALIPLLLIFVYVLRE